MFEKDGHVISYALNMWANYIETGDLVMSAKQAENCGEQDSIKALSTEQMKFIVRLKELAEKHFNT